jgi:hypothetical protein
MGILRGLGRLLRRQTLRVFGDYFGRIRSNPLILLVGAARFELATASPRLRVSSAMAFQLSVKSSPRNHFCYNSLSIPV